MINSSSEESWGKDDEVDKGISGFITYSAEQEQLSERGLKLLKP